jgi:multidrug efflux pump subunit AcrA (membrane-fusion protein)
MAFSLRKVKPTETEPQNVVTLPRARRGGPQLKCFDQMRAPKSSRILAALLLLLIVTIALSLIYVPWQQSVTGQGSVFIFNPGDRPQNVEAQISGRLKQWNAFEGQSVKAGDVLAEIEEIDPKYLDPRQLERLNSQRAAQLASRSAAEARLAALESQLNDLTGSRGAQIPAADQRAQMARDRYEVARQNVAQGKQSVTTAELNLERLKELFEKGLRSKRDLELAELEVVTQRTRLESFDAQLALAAREVEAFGLDKERVVNDTSAQLNAVRVSIASVRETIAKIDSDLLKLDNDIQNLERRVGQRAVRAPRDGKLVRVLKVGAGETVKAGTVLAQIAPATEDQAAEIFLSDYDAPLVQPGDPVRVSFDGWPAIQFVGWPSVAVGTFAGRVKVIDAVGDEAGRVRIVVEPDREAVAKNHDEPWPPLDQLRPGTGARGWVMLRTVSLGFELWRQFNAFPASREKPVAKKAKAEKGGASKDDGYSSEEK